jgi:hypothetical protein
LKSQILYAIASLFVLSVKYPVSPVKTPQTVISGDSWAYTVPFVVHNPEKIEALVSCESQGVNITRMDSNGLYSNGVAQFNGTSTWAMMERKFDFYGSPDIPGDAIHMMDMAIDGGLIGRWSCAHILKMV